MVLLNYLPTLRSKTYAYAVQVDGCTCFITSDQLLTLSDVAHLGVTTIQDVSDQGWIVDRAIAF